MDDVFAGLSLLRLARMETTDGGFGIEGEAGGGGNSADVAEGGGIIGGGG